MSLKKHRKQNSRSIACGLNPARKTAHAKTGRSRMTALIRLDTQRIRKRLTRDCLKARRQCEASEAAWSRFKDEETPAFKRWIASRFGSSLSKARELEAAIGEKESMLDELEHYQFMYGGSRHYCWTGIEKLRERSEKEILARMEAQSAHVPPPNAGGQNDGFEDDEDSDRNEFADEDEDFSDFGKWLDSLFQGGQSPEPPVVNRAGRIKDLYRRLCRKLHPDVVGRSFDERKLKLWHEVQAAYDAMDMDRLESLLALTEMTDGEFGPSTSAMRIIAMTRDFQEARLATDRLLRKAKTDVSWGFMTWTPKKTKRVESEIQDELDQNLAILSRKFAQCEKHLDLWKNPPKPRRKREFCESVDSRQGMFNF